MIEKQAIEKFAKKDIRVKANKKGKHIIVFLNFLRVLVIPFYFLFCPFKIYGSRKAKDGACVYICNHYTMFDPIFMAITTWEGIHFIGKKENFEAPVLGSLMRWMKAIKVNRDGTDVRALLDGLKCLKNGEKVGLFPEGTRNKTKEEILPFRSGASVMSIRAKAPIIPIMLYKKPKIFRITHVLYGEPIELTEYYDRKMTDEDYAKADELLRNALLNMRKEHKEFLENKKKGKR